MRQLILLMTFFTIMTSCSKQEKKNDNLKDKKYSIAQSNTSDILINEIDFRAFKVMTPKGWKKLQARGIDSYVGMIQTDHNDTIMFDLGWYSSKLDTDKENHIVTYDTIDNYKVKIVRPKKTKVGITGIYIDSLWLAGSVKDRFNFYGYNLCAEDQNNLLKVIQTIKFNKKEYGQ